MMEVIYDADTLRQITNEAILDRRLSITKEEFPKILLKINEINYNQAKEGRNESGIRLCYKDYNIKSEDKQWIREFLQGQLTKISLTNSVNESYSGEEMIIHCKW